MANLKYFALAVAAVFAYTACAEDALANNSNATKAAERTAQAGPTKAALVTLEKSAYAAWKSKDAKFWDAFLSDKFVGWGTSGRLDKVSAKKEYSGADCEIKSYALSEEQVSPRGEQAALITYKAAVDGTCGGQKIPANSWAAGVYVRDGRQWKAAFHAQAAVVDPTAPSVKPAYQKGARADDKVKPAAPDARTGTLLAIERAVWEAWKDHDAKRLSDLMAEDISFINIFGIYLANKAEALKNWSGTGCDVKSVGVTDAAATMLSPTVGILTFRAAAEGTCFGQKVGPVWGSSIYIKYGDAWKWAFGINVPAGAEGTFGPTTDTKDEQRCTALTEFNLQASPGGPAIVTSAQILDVPAGGLEHAGQSGYGGATARRPSPIHRYCDVTGYAAPQSKFELKLPLPADWNHKFYFNACGGFCGAVVRELPNFGLERGYASATGNGGHDSVPGFDAVWAANAPELQEDFGWRSNHVVTLIAKAIATHYYGMAIAHSYMAGNSKGGQAVLMEAQRFPEDYDGLMPSAAVYDYTGRNTIASAWFAQGFSDGHGGSVLNAEVAQIVHKSVLQHCGAQAGVEEGLVTDPISCQWKPELIACQSGNSGPDCLNPQQVAAITRLMSPATNSKGDVLYAYPYIPGTETQWIGWNYYGKPGGSATRVPPRLANMDLPAQYLGYLAYEAVRHNVDALTFDFDQDPATLARSRRIYDATSFDLRAFKSRGGKMLMWHGWADGAIVATSSIGYYEGVRKFMGGRDRTEDFFRLFLVPGVHHGGGGPGLSEFDAFSALENWVEQGQAPDKLIAGRVTKGVVERTRPVYPYPVLARYSGKGDPMQADSFAPFDPSRK